MQKYHENLRFLDLFRANSNLKWKAGSKAYSVFGLLMTSVILATVSVLIIYFSHDLRHNLNPVIAQTTRYEAYDTEEIEFSGEFWIKFFKQHPYSGETSIDPDPAYYALEATMDYGNNLFFTKFQDCPGAADFLCMPNFDLAAHLKNTKCTFMAYAIQCFDFVPGIQCKTSDEISDYFSKRPFQIYYPLYTFDPYNYTHPIQATTRSMEIKNVLPYGKVINVELQAMRLITDDGWSSNKKTINIMTVKSITTDLSKSFEVLQLKVKVSPDIITITRTYDKVQDVLAKVGGIMNLVILIIGAVARWYADRSMLNDMVDKLYEIKVDRKEAPVSKPSKKNRTSRQAKYLNSLDVSRSSPKKKPQEDRTLHHIQNSRKDLISTPNYNLSPNSSVMLRDPTILDHSQILYEKRSLFRRRSVSIESSGVAGLSRSTITEELKNFRILPKKISSGRTDLCRAKSAFSKSKLFVCKEDNDADGTMKMTEEFYSPRECLSAKIKTPRDIKKQRFFSPARSSEKSQVQGLGDLNLNTEGVESPANTNYAALQTESAVLKEDEQAPLTFFSSPHAILDEGIKVTLKVETFNDTNIQQLQHDPQANQGESNPIRLTISPIHRSKQEKQQQAETSSTVPLIAVIGPGPKTLESPLASSTKTHDQKIHSAPSMKPKSKLDFLYRIRSFFLSSSKARAFERLKEEIIEHTDIVSLIRRFHELENLKLCLLTEQQRIVFNNLSKPQYRVNPKIPRRDPAKSLPTWMTRRQDDKKKFRQTYEALKQQENKSEVDERLLELFEDDD